MTLRRVVASATSTTPDEHGASRPNSRADNQAIEMTYENYINIFIKYYKCDVFNEMRW